MAMDDSATNATPKRPVFRKWKRAFLAALSRSPDVTLAARRAGIDRATAYRARQRNTQFAAQWDAALLESMDLAEGEAYRRAVRGVRKPVYQGGKLVGCVREHSDTLLIFLLKAHKPGLYREVSRHELSGPDGGPLAVTVIEIDR